MDGEDDGEHRVYCNICDKNHLKSQTHTNKSLKRQQLKELSFQIIFLLKKMGFYVDTCNISKEYKYYDSFSEDVISICIHIEKKIRNPNFFKIDETINDFITNYNKKFDYTS